MKKTFKILVLFTFVMLFCSGCNGNVTRDIRHAGFSVGGDFVCDSFYPADKEDTSYDRIRYFTGTHLINQKGVIYELSLDRKYTNGQNCKMSEAPLIVKAIFDNSIIKAVDNRYYYLVGQNNVEPYTQIPQTDNNYHIYDLLLKDEDVIKVVTANSSIGLYYVLKTDGNVYGEVVTKETRDTPAVISSVQVVYSKSDFGARITDFSYAGDSVNTYVRTEEKVFRMRVLNLKECSKYADVKCNYSMQEDPIFEEYRERIILFNGNTLITDYKKMFTVAN